MIRLAFASLVLLPALALAARPVLLPSGASEIFASAHAKDTAEAFAPFLEQAGEWSPAMGSRRINLEFERESGLKLFDLAALQASGVDVTKGWSFFDHEGSRFLGLHLSKEKNFEKTMAEWAKRRGLRERLAEKQKVTWSRGPGTRAAMGYAKKGSVAVVMLDAGGRMDGLEGALSAWDKAVPVRPPSSGAVQVWLSSREGAKDLWLSFSPRADGLDLKGSARSAKGWFRKELERGAWVSQANAGGAKKEVPIRLRVLPGPLFVTQARELLAALSDPKSAELAPLEALRALEFVSLKVDAQALRSTSKGREADWNRVLSPLLRLHLPRTEKPRTLGAMRLEPDPAGALVLPAFLGARSEPEIGAESALGCGWSSPVAALRLDLAQISSALAPIGLLSAMKNELLLAVAALNGEYGFLLRASRPLVAVVCEEPSGRVSLEAEWRFEKRG